VIFHSYVKLPEGSIIFPTPAHLLLLLPHQDSQNADIRRRLDPLRCESWKIIASWVKSHRLKVLAPNPKGPGWYPKRDGLWMFVDGDFPQNMALSDYDPSYEVLMERKKALPDPFLKATSWEFSQRGTEMYEQQCDVGCV